MKGAMKAAKKTSRQLGATQFAAKVERLKAEGKIPSLERLLAVIAETRRLSIPQCWGRGRDGPNGAPMIKAAKRKTARRGAKRVRTLPVLDCVTRSLIENGIPLT